MALTPTEQEFLQHQPISTCQRQERRSEGNQGETEPPPLLGGAGSSLDLLASDRAGSTPHPLTPIFNIESRDE